MLARILGSMVFLVLFAVGAIFASILLVVAATVLLVAVIYLWWKANRARDPARNESWRRDSGHTIEGEYSIDQEAEKRELAEHLSPSAEPFTGQFNQEELRQASTIKVWLVRREDHFRGGGDRQPFPVALCLSERDAREEATRTAWPLPGGGSSGYLVEGPFELLSCPLGADKGEIIRTVLRNLAAGVSAPVRIGDKL